MVSYNEILIAMLKEQILGKFYKTGVISQIILLHSFNNCIVVQLISHKLSSLKMLNLAIWALSIVII